MNEYPYGATEGTHNKPAPNIARTRTPSEAAGRALMGPGVWDELNAANTGGGAGGRNVRRRAFPSSKAEPKPPGGAGDGSRPPATGGGFGNASP